MKKRFAEIIDREVFHESSDGVLGVISAAEKCDTLHNQAMKEEREKLKGILSTIQAEMAIVLNKPNNKGYYACLKHIIKKIVKENKIDL